MNWWMRSICGDVITCSVSFLFIIFLVFIICAKFSVHSLFSVDSILFIQLCDSRFSLCCHTFRIFSFLVLFVDFLDDANLSFALFLSVFFSRSSFYFIKLSPLFFFLRGLFWPPTLICFFLRRLSISILRLSPLVFSFLSPFAAFSHPPHSFAPRSLSLAYTSSLPFIQNFITFPCFATVFLETASRQS